MAILGIIWAFPLTAFGWVVVKLGGCVFATVYERHGVSTRFYRHPPRGRLTWFFGEVYTGVTFGRICIYHGDRFAEPLADTAFIRHEHAHTIQATRWGIFLAPAYGIASLISWIRCGSTWNKNYFELQAQEAEK